MGRRRRTQPRPVGGLRRIVVSAAPVSGRERRLYLGTFRCALRNVRLRLLCRLSVPAFFRHFVGRCSPGGAPLRRRRADQGTGGGPAGAICLDRPMVEPRFPAARRARQLEALRRPGARRSRCRGALLEPDRRLRYRRQRRFLHEGSHLVSIPVHRIPRRVRLRVQFPAAGQSECGLGLSALAHHPGARRNLRPRRIAGAGRGRLAVPPHLPPGRIRLLRFPGSAFAHFKRPAHQRPHRRPPHVPADAWPDSDRH